MPALRLASGLLRLRCCPRPPRPSRLASLPGSLLPIVACLGAGCIATVPAMVMEAPEALAPRQVAITGAGGAAGPLLGGGLAPALGGAGRLRVGIGSEQEVGLEGAYLRDESWWAASGMVSWKVRVDRATALVVAAGATYESVPGPLASFGPYSSLAPSLDVGVVTATGDASTPARLYFGPRLTLGGNQSGLTESLLVPGGFIFTASRFVRVFVEAGFRCTFFELLDESGDSFHVVPYLYGAAGLTVLLGGS